MTNKPILFNTEMVNAILEGRKTQTRRVVKDFADRTIAEVFLPDGSYGKYGTRGWRGMLPDSGDGNTYCIEVKPPYEPGDILYVRETWCENKNPQSKNFGRYEYRADYYKSLCQELIGWHPSIHMPKKAARIFLRVKDVWLERLQGITEEQAKAEGAFRAFEYSTPEGAVVTLDEDGYYDLGFKALWDSTVKKSDMSCYGWDANPWVWVVWFERCEKPKGWCE